MPGCSLGMLEGHAQRTLHARFLEQPAVQEAQPLMYEPGLRLGSALSLAKSDSIMRCASLESKMRTLYKQGAGLSWCCPHWCKCKRQARVCLSAGASREGV